MDSASRRTIARILLAGLAAALIVAFGVRHASSAVPLPADGSEAGALDRS